MQKVSQLKILARSLTVEINDYREADTFKAQIDYKSFPFDPRCIRSCKVSIYMEDRKRIFSGKKLDLLEPSQDNVVFVGFADEESIIFDETSRTVSIEGRDQTSLFIDQKYLGPPIALTKPVDDIIRDMVSSQESTKKIEVINNTDGELPILANLAPDLSTTTSVLNGSKNGTYWDMIQEIVERAGLICYIDIDKLIITKPRNLYKKQNVKNFIYGKNLSKLEMKRKLGRHKGFNVLVRSVNVLDKTVIEAKIPFDSKRSDLGGGKEVTIIQLDKDGKKIEPEKAAPYINFNVSDISNKDKLIEVGESIFEEMSRQQMEGSLSTKEMMIPESPYRNDLKEEKYIPYASRYSIPVEFSKIRNGSAIQIFIDQDDLEMVKTLSSIEQKKAYLIRQKFESQVAEALAESLNRTSYVFYVKSVTFKIDNREGFSMDIEFINFIEVENQGIGS